MSEFFGFILYPVSAILWFWHQIFGFILGPDSGFAWALSVFFLVFTLRVVLLKPAISQMRSARKMQKFAPQIQKLKEKYKNDRQRQAQEMQKLQSEHGVSPLGGCLPMLLQIPVFLSLFRVLRDFKPGADSNYVFDRQGVASFVDADIFGAKLSNWITQPEAQLANFGTDRGSMIAVAIPLMIVASVATFFTMRLSMRRQTDMSMSNPQTAVMGKVMMYIAPIGALISGWFLPIAVLLYWLANNFWTLGQQHFVSKKIDREQEREKEKEKQEKERRQSAARPKPGQKPDRGTKGGDGESVATVDADVADETSGSETSNGSGSASSTKTTANSTGGGKQSTSNGQRSGGGARHQGTRPGKKRSQPKKRKKRK